MNVPNEFLLHSGRLNWLLSVYMVTRLTTLEFCSCVLYQILYIITLQILFVVAVTIISQFYTL